MSVVFTTIDSISIDGIPAGNIVDVISNHAPRRAEVLAAYRVFVDAEKAKRDEAVVKLEADKAKLTTELATATQAKTTLEGQVSTLEAEKQSLRAEIADLDQALDAEQQLTATLQAKVVDLEQYRPFNPRILKGEAFYNRVSKEDMVTLLASDDATLVTVGKTIEAYRAHHWPVVMDSQDFTNLVGYVMQSGVFDGDEVNAIMRDATREEAYRVPE
jgi:multidrug efflux pump subunit AcrA (membrane-fusion protein)